MNREETLSVLNKLGFTDLDVNVNFDLSCADLSYVNLSYANLYRANLSGANMNHANLYRANLSGANLSGANMNHADLSDATLYRADLSDAALSHVNLYRATLSGADLRNADLYRTNLSYADLSYADLTGATYGAGVLIGNNPINLSGLQWNVWIFQDHIKIGCEVHSKDEWEQFTDEKINSMDDKALAFWKENKSRIMSLC